MRRSILLTLSCFFLFAITAAASADADNEPQYVGNFAAMGKDGKYIALERVTAEVVTRVRALGFGGGETHVSVSGAASPIRFKVGEPIEFVVKVASQDKDPLGFVQFYRLKVSHRNRILPAANVGAFGLKATSQVHSSDVTYSATKLGTDFFVITPLTPLQPGEYALSTVEDGQVGFCFGVDE